MSYAIKITTISLFTSMGGTMLGSFLGIAFSKIGKRLFSAVLGITAGLMMSIVCFDLLPESFNTLSLYTASVGIILGVLTIMFIDSKVSTYRQKRKIILDSRYIRTGTLLAIGIGLHNIPEGLAIGSSYITSATLGVGMAVIIGLHDIPEGFAITLPLKMGKVPDYKIFFYIVFTQIPMMISVFLGALLSELMPFMTAFSLTFSSGAMLYIICSEIIPEANRLHSGRTSAFADIIGFILGLFMSKYLLN